MKNKIFIVSAALALILAGCGSKAEVAEESAPAVTTVQTTEATTEAVEKDEKPKTIGKESDKESVYKIELVNSTGADITEFSVKSDSEEKYPANMLESKDVFKANEKRILYYEMPEDKEDDEDTDDGDAFVLTPEYTIQIKFSENKTAELHNFPFDDMKEGTIKLEDDIVYLEYKSILSGDKVSTKESESMINSKNDDSDAHEAVTESYSEYNYNSDSYTYDDDTYSDYTPSYQEPATQAQAVQTEPPVVQTEPPVTEAPTQNDPNSGCLDGGLFY